MKAEIERDTIPGIVSMVVKKEKGSEKDVYTNSKLINGEPCVICYESCDASGCDCFDSGDCFDICDTDPSYKQTNNS